MPDLAYLNGEIMPIDQAMVPIEDRGYQFGDGVYEFVASYAGRIYRLEDHLDRMERSLRELDYTPLSREAIRTAILRLLERSGYPRAGIYIQITRGVAPRNHAFDPGLSHQIVMTARVVHEIPEEKRRQGIDVITVRDTRWDRCDIKTIQLIANSQAKQKALAAGCADAIFVAESGVVREGTSSNLFIVSDGQLKTHPLTHHILPGITRKALLEICPPAGLPVAEDFFDTDALYAAEEAFLTGTVTEVLPIVTIDGRSIGNGKVGPMARRVFDLLRRDALADAPG